MARVTPTIDEVLFADEVTFADAQFTLPDLAVPADRLLVAMVMGRGFSGDSGGAYAAESMLDGAVGGVGSSWSAIHVLHVEEATEAHLVLTAGGSGSGCVIVFTIKDHDPDEVGNGAKVEGEAHGNAVDASTAITTTQDNSAVIAAMNHRSAAALASLNWDEIGYVTSGNNTGCGAYTATTNAGEYTVTIEYEESGQSKAHSLLEIIGREQGQEEPMSTITIQRDGDEVFLDTYIDEANPDTNHGDSTQLRIGCDPSGNRVRTLLDIDLTEVVSVLTANPTWQVISAQLVLPVVTLFNLDAGTPVWFQRFLRDDWAEDQSTWNSYRVDQGTAQPVPWAEAGCSRYTGLASGDDYTQVNRVLGLTPGEAGDWGIDGVRQLVLDALTLTQYQRLLLRASMVDEEVTGELVIAASSEAVALEDRPRLIVGVGEPINGGGGGINQSAAAFPAATAAAFPAAWRD